MGSARAGQQAGRRNAVFVTGATGFLGSPTPHRPLAHNPPARVYALIRHVDRWPAFAARLPPGRVIPIAGDLREPGLGLDAADRLTLARDVGRVVHLAADIIFSRALAESRATNVGGTQHLLDAARGWPALTQFIHVSSAFVAGRRMGRIAERDIRPEAGWVNPYEQSKSEAECLVRVSSLPWLFLRPTTVVCDDVTGAITQINAVHVALRMMYAGVVPLLPGDRDTLLDVVPVDYIAEAVVRALAGAAPTGSTLHLCAGRGAAPPGGLPEWTWGAWAASRPWRRQAIPLPELVDLRA